jgi:lycopene cyclase-like protein
VCDPRLGCPFNASYGAWEASLKDLNLERAVLARHPQPQVRTPRKVHSLSETYVRLSSEGLQELLLDRAVLAGVRLQQQHVARQLVGDSRHLVVDATGPEAVLTSSSPPAFYQSAYGVWLELGPTDSPLHAMYLMDFGEGEPDLNDEPQSFLYAMPEQREAHGPVVFAQETVLAHERPVSFADLEARLHRRFARMGWGSARVLGEERCLIPMGAEPPPRPSTNVLAYGAAASMVNPASGYQLSHALGAAEGVAAAIVSGFAGGDPVKAARRGYEALWSAERRRTWRTLRRAMATVLGLSPKSQRDFFDCFVQLPPRFVRGFMDGSLRHSELLLAMTLVFARLPFSQRWSLVRSFVAGKSRYPALKSSSSHPSLLGDLSP